ncbi:hypothetical protein SARC_08125 [Sphaeroforma arctica JP610]|uniref:Uncharacterized protein n=1 Tax=Sphaeroforma arctica JP610 TaxID=667725 RepID=A0A0L0FRT8_9EUKA|nr:hypothetical protein SARC_08125 [Sphaeroforma arctica JP610]KNC79480.1 hypothetical protein SARC_08125 [Sphaeroforma arctica JP610]|eukprot:XP_014153382.1 hypothetical protein SARC_08125 [Sphaeroforma arctica JP610]
MGRIESDDAVHSTVLTEVFDSVLSNIRDTGFWYVSMPNAAFWLTNVGGREKLGLYNKIDEHTPAHIAPHFPKCADLDQCRTYLCRGGEPIPIKKDGSMGVSPHKWCPSNEVPLAIYTQTGIQDSQSTHIERIIGDDTPRNTIELEGEAVCDVLHRFNITLPIIGALEPVYPECVLFSGDRTRCDKSYNA